VLVAHPFIVEEEHLATIAGRLRSAVDAAVAAV